MHAILLAGLAVAGVPVLLHLLLRQQPKRLPFPALRFLKVHAKTTQRRIKLRHILLLLLRVLLLLLFCLALYQPVLPNAGTFAGVDLSSGKPVAAIVVVDTTPSMGYRFEGRTRLEEAVRRAQEFVDALPASSRVAVLTTADTAGVWELSPADAKRRIATFTETEAGGLPLSSVLRSVYPLFQALADEGPTGDEPPPKLVALFTDRTAGSFAADAADELKSAAEAVPAGPVGHFVFDVGVETPVDVALLSSDVTPVSGPAGRPVTVQATVLATGADVAAATVVFALDDGSLPQQQEVALRAGTPAAVTFTLTGLKAGLYQGEVRLATPDNLGPADVPGFNNVQYVTFRVGAARKILTIADSPDEVRFWQLAHEVKGDFAAEVVPPTRVPNLLGYQAVCLMGVRNPGVLWPKLAEYVNRGGRLLVAPTGTNRVDLAEYTPEASQGLMPAALVRVRDLTTEPAPPKDRPDAIDLRSGASLVLDENAVRHPLLAPVAPLQTSGNIDFLRRPSLAWRFWLTTAPEPGGVIVRYGDAATPEAQSPAILEKSFPNGGRVVLLTTRLDQPGLTFAERWNDVWETDGTSWYLFFPNLLAKYLAGEGLEARYQFPTGQGVVLPAPELGDAAGVAVRGPGAVDPAALEYASGEVRLRPQQTSRAGNYRLTRAGSDEALGFSLNVPADESNLAKVPAEAFAPLKAVVVPVDKQLDLGEFVQSAGGSVPLFGPLVLLVFLVFAGEAVLASRFYGRPASP